VGAGRADQQTRYISLALAHKIYLVNSERWRLNTAPDGRPKPTRGSVRSRAAPRQRVLAREHVRPARFPAAIKADSPSLIMWRSWRRARSRQRARRRGCADGRSLSELTQPTQGRSKSPAFTPAVNAVHSSGAKASLGPSGSFGIAHRDGAGQVPRYFRARTAVAAAVMVTSHYYRSRRLRTAMTWLAMVSASKTAARAAMKVSFVSQPDR
jgi:hypothetical protein